MKIFLAAEVSEHSERALEEIAAHSLQEGWELRNISGVEQAYPSEIFSEERLYGSHCRDRENLMRTGRMRQVDRTATVRMLSP